MALKILSAKNFSAKLKVTIQLTGRLGFTETTATQLQLKAGKFAKFAQDDETSDLFLCVSDKKSVDAFDIRKSGKYYFVPTTSLFDMMGFDYKKKTIMFDLVRAVEYDCEMDGEVYKMIKRELLKKGFRE